MSEAALRQLRHELQMLASDLDRAKHELAAERARTAAFAAQLEQALARLAERDRPAPPPPAGETEVALRAEVAALLQHREEARLLRASTSWRITRPLRALSRPGYTLRVLLGRS